MIRRHLPSRSASARFGAALALSLLALPALAASEGCYARTYAAEHLRRVPGQTVRHLIVRLERDASRQPIFGLEARLAGQPQAWRAGGPCEAEGDLWRCKPDTDGDPEIAMRRVGDTLQVSVPIRLKVVDDVTGPDLNEARIERAGQSHLPPLPRTGRSLPHPVTAGRTISGARNARARPSRETRTSG